MKELLLLIITFFAILSCDRQSSFTKDVLKANNGNKIFMNNESIELLNTIDSSIVSKQIRVCNQYILSFKEMISKNKILIDKIEKGRGKNYSNADADDLISDIEKLIEKCQNNINDNNETIILLYKLKNGGYAISVNRTDNVTPQGFPIPEWVIVDTNFKYVGTSHELPYFVN